jgi:hypothetical protein
MESTTASYLRWLKNALVFREKVNRELGVKAIHREVVQADGT